MFWQFLTFYLANILTFYPAHVLTHFLALVLTYILTFFLARSLTLHLAYILTFHLTFYLANILTYFLTFYLACILAHILLFYLAHILTCYLRLVLPTAIRSWWLKSGAAHRHPELAKGRREGLRERRGGTVLIKSDGPHLAGGEQKPAVRWSPVLASGGAGRVSVPCNWSTQLGWVGLGGAGWGWSTRCRHVVYKGWGGVGHVKVPCTRSTHSGWVGSGAATPASCASARQCVFTKGQPSTVTTSQACFGNIPWESRPGAAKNPAYRRLPPVMKRGGHVHNVQRLRALNSKNSTVLQQKPAGPRCMELHHACM